MLIYFTTNITIWPYTERARSFPRPISPKICHIFGNIGEYKLSLYEYKLSLCFLSLLLGGRNFTTFLGKFLFSPVRVPLSNCSTLGRGRSGVRFPPGPLSFGIQLCLSICLLSFPQICHNSRAFTPSSIFPKISHNFGAFHELRLHFLLCGGRTCTTFLGAFVLRFRSCECTACVYHSFECTFGPTVAR